MRIYHLKIMKVVQKILLILVLTTFVACKHKYEYKEYKISKDYYGNLEWETELKTIKATDDNDALSEAHIRFTSSITVNNMISQNLDIFCIPVTYFIRNKDYKIIGSAWADSTYKYTDSLNMALIKEMCEKCDKHEIDIMLQSIPYFDQLN